MISPATLAPIRLSAAPAPSAPVAGPTDTFSPGAPAAPLPNAAAMRAVFGSRVTGAHEMWQVSVPGGVQAPPAVGPDGTLYVVTEKGLSAVSSDGQVRWEAPQQGLQTYATPLVSDDGKRIHVVGGHEAPGLMTYDERGNRVDEKNLPTAQVPAVFGPDGSIYQGDYQGGVHRVGGTHTWSRDIGRHVNGEMATLSDGTLVLIGDPGSLHAFRPDGTVAFERFVKDDDPDGSLATCVGVCVTPDDQILAVSWASQLYAIDAKGEIAWKFDGHVGKRTDEMTPDELESTGWGNTTMGTTPVLSPDRQTVYMGGMDGRLFAIDRTGHLRWTAEVGDDMGHHGVQVGDDGTIYTVSDRTGTIHAVSPEGKGLWTYEPDKKSNYAYIATHDRDVYLVTRKGDMYALTSNAIERRLEEARSAAPAGPPPTIKVDDGFVVIAGVRVPVRKA